MTLAGLLAAMWAVLTALAILWQAVTHDEVVTNAILVVAIISLVAAIFATEAPAMAHMGSYDMQPFGMRD